MASKCRGQEYGILNGIFLPHSRLWKSHQKVNCGQEACWRADWKLEAYLHSYSHTAVHRGASRPRRHLTLQPCPSSTLPASTIRCSRVQRASEEAAGRSRMSLHARTHLVRLHQQLQAHPRPLPRLQTTKTRHRPRSWRRRSSRRASMPSGRPKRLFLRSVDSLQTICTAKSAILTRSCFCPRSCLWLCRLLRDLPIHHTGPQ